MLLDVMNVYHHGWRANAESYDPPEPKLFAAKVIRFGVRIESARRQTRTLYFKIFLQAVKLGCPFVASDTRSQS
jgi:hypothetical protein